MCLYIFFYDIFVVKQYFPALNISLRLWLCGFQCFEVQNLCIINASLTLFFKIRISTFFLQSRMSVYVTHSPAGTSVQNMIHWSQVGIPEGPWDLCQISVRKILASPDGPLCQPFLLLSATFLLMVTCFLYVACHQVPLPFGTCSTLLPYGHFLKRFSSCHL